MKKFIICIICAIGICFTSCGVDNSSRNHTRPDEIVSTEYNDQNVTVTILSRYGSYIDLNYQKTNINGHTCFVRVFYTRGDIGSDVLHIEAMCPACSH